MDWCMGNYHYRRFSLESFLSEMERRNINKIELWASGPSLHLEDFSASRLDALGKDIRRRGLSLACLTPETCSYPISLASNDESYRKRSLQFYEDHIEAAQILECPLLLVTPGVTVLDTDQEIAYQRLLEGLDKLATYAGNKGITLALEPLTRLSTSLLNKASQLKAILDTIGSPNLKGLLDISVAYRVDKETAGDYTNALGSRLAHIHFTDLDERTGRHHLIPGTGTLALDEELLVLENAGYNGLLSFELLDFQYQSVPSEATDGCIRYIGRKDDLK